jgi:quinol monooxygenase YgiN
MLPAKAREIVAGGKALAIRRQGQNLETHMILATIRVAIPTQQRGAALKILGSMAEKCGDNQGCLSCHLYRDLQEDNILVLKQVWRTEEDLNLHLRSVRDRGLMMVLETALKPPELRIDTISSTTGIETIEKARSPAR